MASAEDMQGKWDGRDPNRPNYPAVSYAGVTHYKSWDFGQNWVDRPAGADPGMKPGQLWWSPSAGDHITVMTEILSKKFRGKYTVLHMISAIFAVTVLGESPDDVISKMGL